MHCKGKEPAGVSREPRTGDPEKMGAGRLERVGQSHSFPLTVSTRPPYLKPLFTQPPRNAAKVVDRPAGDKPWQMQSPRFPTSLSLSSVHHPVRQALLGLGPSELGASVVYYLTTTLGRGH